VERISARRRAICGDLTSCFDFTSHVSTIPLLPDTGRLRQLVDLTDPKLPAPAVPATGKPFRSQERARCRTSRWPTSRSPATRSRCR
jgi:phospholipase C